MLPLIPLALSVAPELARWLFGGTAEKTTAAVAAVVQTVTGTTEAGMAQAAVARDPKVAADLRMALARIAAEAEAGARAADLAALQAQLADVAGARAQTVALAAARSAVAWGAPIVSFIVLVVFGCLSYMIVTKRLPEGDAPILIAGGLLTMAKDAVAYWLGSSAGSKDKDETIRQAQTALAGSAPVLPGGVLR